MNIFVLHTLHAGSAADAVDAHINKQVLECFQLLATAYPDVKLPKKNGGHYAGTHENHPLVRWTARCPGNALYVLHHAEAFAKEHKKRFGTSLDNSYPFAEATEHFEPDLPWPQPKSYPLYVPEYIRRKLLPDGNDYDLGSTPRETTDLSIAIQGYRFYYVLEKYRSMDKFEWSCRIPEWYIDMCVKLGRPPF